MTNIIDNWLITQGFEQEDLLSKNNRASLYYAIIITLISGLSFFSLVFKQVF